ncbi:hypothetical protein BH23VER1_BH23VER1_33670 [soil metagenome]
MKIPRPEPATGELVNVSSLLDVMFILIIFFLATTTFQQQERDVAVSLPDAAAGDAVSEAPAVIVVNVRADGTYVVASEEMGIEGVGEAVAAAREANPQQKVLIRGDRNALHGHVAAAVLACRNAGIVEADLGYQIPE